MDAIDRFDELQSTNEVMSCVLLSLKVPVAVNCFVAPVGMVEFSGAIVNETSVALVTVIDAVPVIEPDVALSVALPAATAVTTPEESTVRTPGALEDHCADGRICVLPSSKVPVAVNCCAVPAAIVAVAGLSVSEVRCAFTTVTVVESLSAPTVAVIVVVPAPTREARPVLSMVATDAVEELQVTPAERSAVDPSL
jgi:hypothetical protein